MDNGIKNIEINGSLYSFDFSMDSILKFVAHKKWNQPWRKTLGSLLGEDANWPDQIEFLKMAHQIAITKEKGANKLPDTDLANNYLDLISLFDDTLTAHLTSFSTKHVDAAAGDDVKKI